MASSKQERGWTLYIWLSGAVIISLLALGLALAVLVARHDAGTVARPYINVTYISGLVAYTFVTVGSIVVDDAGVADNTIVVFYSDNGSTAVEVALKMAYQSHCHRGEPDRTLFIGVEHGYHGHTTGTMDVSPYKFRQPHGGGAPASTAGTGGSTKRRRVGRCMGLIVGCPFTARLAK